MAHRRRGRNSWKLAGMNLEVNGFWGLLVLIADIWAIVNIFSSTASTGRKVLWTVLVVVLPVVGFIIWLLLGPKKAQ
jgi:hypothetical protein